MTLRKRSLIIIIVIMLLLVSLINASTRFILLRRVSNLEEKYCVINIQLLSNVVTYEESNLLHKVEDYSVWDDTYAFVANQSTNYITNNLTLTTFINVGINFFIIVDPNGKVIFESGYDLTNGKPLTPSVELHDLITQSELFHNTKEALTGIVLVDGKPMMVAAHPILTSMEAGPVSGILIFGRYLNEVFARQLTDITQLSLQMATYTNSDLGQELLKAKKAPTDDANVFINILNDHSIAGYKVFQDVFGNPAFIMRIVMERDIYNRSHDTIMFFIYVVFFGSTFFLIAAFTLLDRQVLSRITNLSKSVTRIRLSGQLVDRVLMTGKDEIAFLGSEINEMMQSLETADGQLRQSRDLLEMRIEERTAELTSVNEALKYEISEREESQRALNDAYNEIHLILNSISSILIAVNSDGIVTQWNPVAANLFGLSSADAMGNEFVSLPIQWDWQTISAALDECARENHKVRVENQIFESTKAGQRILGITLTPLLRTSEAHSGFLLVASDITERRLLEQKVGQTNKLEAIGQLAAGVAHEINTPTQLVGSNLRFLEQLLGPILGIVDQFYTLNRLVKNGTATPAEALKLEKAVEAVHLEFFRREAPQAIAQSLEGIERITHIVAAMRFFMHPGSEHKELANLNDVIQNALSLSRNEWKNVAEIQTELDPDLPAVACQPSEISQVILILLVNAVHAIQDASAAGNDAEGLICISSRQLEDGVEIRLSDTGTGIPDKIRDKVFDLFFTTKEVGRGTGQGLAIAYTVIVKKHGGTIEFESEVGRGTTFIVRIPLKATYET